jgi:hypothetical protein
MASPSSPHPASVASPVRATPDLSEEWQLEAPDPHTFHEGDDDVLSEAILRALAGSGEALPAPIRLAAPGDARHRVAHRHDWPWLPTQEHHHLALHPYCVECGAVKYVGSMKPRPMGGLVNTASRLADAIEAQGHRVTEAQMRLIVKRLQKEGAADQFLQSRGNQERILLDTFSKYTGLHPDTLATFLRSC